jgi:phage recombination protein Bet
MARKTACAECDSTVDPYWSQAEKQWDILCTKSHGEHSLQLVEHPMARFRRTGQGDTITRMQVERADAKAIKRARERTNMATGTDIVKFQDPQGGEVGLTIAGVKAAFCPKATDDEALRFLRLCQFQEMNPFLREAYLIKYQDDRPAAIVVGKGFYEKRANIQPEFRGMTAGIVFDMDGQFGRRPGSLLRPGERLVGGWAIVKRSDRDDPYEIEVALSEYDKGQSLWKSMPATMIRKVALVQALREAFPDKFQGIPAGDVIDEDVAGSVESVVIEAESKVLPSEEEMRRDQLDLFGGI